MRRITIDSRVSTEAWCFDDIKKKEEERWSFPVFGEDYKNARVYGTVTGRSGQKFKVKWDVNGGESVIALDYLLMVVNQ